MDTNRFVQLRKIFDAAVVLPASDWPNRVREACGQNESLYAEAMDLLLAHRNGASTASNGAPISEGSCKMIGPYRILRKLGAGGMGMVYLAVRDDGAFRKHVAVKLLRSNHASHDFIQRFHQERQVLANLDHPNVARILDGGQTADGLPYHVMEYVEGLPLDRFCDTQKLGLADRIRLFQQVVSAVSYLHENMVVHRDLKPSNILVTAQGQVKLLDFGIAKVQAPLLDAPDLTGPANRILTPSYASPEQMGGAPISRASDIYSLGVILYELLTGRLPYEDATAKLTEEPPLPSANIREDLQRTAETTAQLRRRIVGDLDQIVLLCLRRNPQSRYASAGALAEDLGRFLEGRSVLARKEPLSEWSLRFLKRNRLAVAVCVLVLASLGVGIWQTVAAQIHTRMADAQEAAIKRVLDALEHGDSKLQPGHDAQLGASSIKPRVDDVRKLRKVLEQQLAPAWEPGSGLTPERKNLMERAVRYLDNLRPYVEQNAVLAMELAAAYQDIGNLCGSNREFALMAYTNAARTLQQATSGDPNHGPQSEEWEIIVGRITSLGGAVPGYVPVVIKSITPKPAPLDKKQKDVPSPAPLADATPQEQVPVYLPIDRQQYETLRNSIDVTASKVKVANETFIGLKNSLQASGKTIHPDIATYNMRMQSALDTARDSLERGDLDGVQANLVMANEFARRVMKAAGR